MQAQLRSRPTIYALAAIGLWGTLAALVLRLGQIPPFLLVGCALILGGLCGVRGLTVRGLSLRVLLLGVYGLFAYHLCLFLALRWAPAVEANLVNYLWPLLIVVLSPLIVPGTSLQPRHVGGSMLGFSGAALLVTGGSFHVEASSVAGYALAFAAAVIWSTYSLLTKRIGTFPTSAISTFCLISGVLALGCHGLFEPCYVFTPSDAVPLLAIGLGPMGAAFYLWDRAIKAGDPRTIGTLAYLTPLLSTLLVAGSGKGHISPLAMLAMVMIVGGAAIGTWSR